MAIAYDNGTGVFTVATNPGTFDHTVGAGSNRILFVGIYGDTNRTVTAASYNGVAMTAVSTQIDLSDDHFNALYYLVAPDTGTNTVSVTCDNTSNLAMFAVSYTGAAQASPIGGITKSSATTDPIAVTVTVGTDNSWIVACIGAQGPTAYTPGANTTYRVGGDPSEPTRAGAAYDTNSAQAAGSRDMNFDPNSGPTVASYFLAEFKEATGGGGGARLFTLLGVGT